MATIMMTGHPTIDGKLDGLHNQNVETPPSRLASVVASGIDNSCTKVDFIRLDAGRVQELQMTEQCR